METTSFIMRVLLLRICLLMFKDIWTSRHQDDSQQWLSNKMFKWNLGDVKIISFWKDWWWGSGPLCTSFSRLFKLANDKDISVQKMCSLGRFQDLNLWKRVLRGWESDAEFQLMDIVDNLRLINVKDSLLWLGNNSEFTVKDLYQEGWSRC